MTDEVAMGEIDETRMDASEFVASRRPALVVLDAPDPFERGRQRGLALGDRIHELAAAYRALLRLKADGRELPLAEHLAGMRAATAAWWPEAAEEIDGVADGAGIDVDEAWLLNCRTELLAEARRAGAPARGECSVVVRADGAAPTFGFQTWDWQEHMADFWHPVAVDAVGSPSWCGITEAGILAKIGLNDAGLAVHLDILFHDEDCAGGVPVHLVAARLLSTCASLDEAVRVAESAPVSASSALTIHDGARAVAIELSPAGIAALDPQRGLLVHGNRFQTPALAEAEFEDEADPEAGEDAVGRTRLLRERAEAHPDARTRDDVAALFRSEPDDPGQLSCIPKPTDLEGSRWHTLVTIATRPAQRALEFRAGLPNAGGEWRALEPRATSGGAGFREV